MTARVEVDSPEEVVVDLLIDVALDLDVGRVVLLPDVPVVIHLGLTVGLSVEPVLRDHVKMWQLWGSTYW